MALNRSRNDPPGGRRTQQDYAAHTCNASGQVDPRDEPPDSRASVSVGRPAYGMDVSNTNQETSIPPEDGQLQS